VIIAVTTGRDLRNQADGGSAGSAGTASTLGG
jgi:hypothetical protein